MSGGDTQKPAANWITLFNQAFKLLKYTAVRISNGPSETSVPLPIACSTTTERVYILLYCFDFEEERGGEGEKRLRETGGERASSNQRFTICQSSSNKLSEFYSRPV